MALAEHSDRGKALDKVFAAQVDLCSAVHLQVSTQEQDGPRAGRVNLKRHEHALPCVLPCLRTDEQPVYMGRMSCWPCWHAAQLMFSENLCCCEVLPCFWLTMGASACCVVQCEKSPFCQRYTNSLPLQSGCVHHTLGTCRGSPWWPPPRWVPTADTSDTTGQRS